MQIFEVFYFLNKKLMMNNIFNILFTTDVNLKYWTSIAKGYKINKNPLDSIQRVFYSKTSHVISAPQKVLTGIAQCV